MTTDRLITPGEKFSLPAKGFSMRPEIMPGDIIHVISYPPEKLRIGDIAVFKNDGRLIAHRVVEKYSESQQFLEKGDGKYVPYIIDYKDVIGKVIGVEKENGYKSLDGVFPRIYSRLIAAYSLWKYLSTNTLSKIKHRIIGIGEHY